ncbi:5-formyltetrahydrofolate cyclo-ligase [Anaplasma phagocytophilum]|uniref:5-formyltetrahydrofolate cyclo-ligase n=1 Tax=Anaplasma phagocytophilum TaxID=948 RepID=UPI0020104753|nr:5-formyltetrahydrofolate cyclo-ligase [Anaplasma phagocytophilum]UQD54644.1 5-formyltetrahydrofolate cyclo-ligase [Anaplasma phagocytophilum]
MDHLEEKVRLRKKYRKLRKAVTTVADAAQMLLQNTISILSFGNHDIVSGYIPIDGEIDVLPLMNFISKTSVVLVPEVKKDSRMLTFRRWFSGINELGEALSPSILLIPLVAFDRRLYRLGFGGGYYDYTIEHLKRKGQCKCVGIAYDLQLCANLPVCEHDQKLDLVITEKGVYS